MALGRSGAALSEAASLLRPDGVLAVVETHHVCPADGDRFFAEIQEVYDEIADSGWFEAPRTRRHVWSQTYTADEYIDVLRTYSGHIVMTDRQRDRLFGAVRERIGARERPVVEKHYLNVVYVARRS